MFSSSGKRQTESVLILNLIRVDCLQLFHTPEQVAYAEVNVNGLRKIWRVRDKVFLDWISNQYYKTYQKPPHTQALRDTVSIVEGICLFEASEEQVYVRLAEHRGCVYFDLGSSEGSVVEVMPSGWQIIQESPVRFLRPRHMLPLPLPERGGRVKDLMSVLNLTPDDWSLVAAWLIGSLNPRGPYPLLFVQGEQGSGKSTFAQMLKDLIDPNTSPLRAHPRELQDLMLSAANSWILCFDNLSHLPVWLSDGLCRLSTGGSFATRALYSENREVIFNATRPVILTGIEDLAIRGDLLDRTVLLYLPAIEAERRRTHRQVRAQYEALRPQILGALLDAVSVALRHLPDLQLEQLPRMADFTMWVVAASSGLGLAPETFLADYRSNIAASHDLILEGLPIVSAVQALLKSQPVWEGTATELHQTLTSYLPHKARRENHWPKNSRGLSNALRRLAPNLRDLGINVCFYRTNQARIIRIEPYSESVS